MEQSRKNVSVHYKKYPWKNSARQTKRRAQLLQRLPKWVNLIEIKKFYENCPKGFHVDHIIPLKNKNVSGLHVIENLQYLSAHDNIVKHNIFPFEDMKYE